jgi:uncharacterized protein (TIGR02246 family)
MSVRARSFVGALSLAFWLGALAVGCRTAAAPAPSASPAMPQSQEAAVRGAVEQWRQAYEIRSLEALAKLYAQDQAVVVQQGSAVRGWPAIEAVLTSRLGNATAVRVRLKDVAVLPLGDAGATLVAGMSREITGGATTLAEEGVVTLSLRATAEGAWLIVSEHYSYLPR